MDQNFRDLPCVRIEMDEQWQYVGAHAGRVVREIHERKTGICHIKSLLREGFGVANGGATSPAPNVSVGIKMKIIKATD